MNPLIGINFVHDKSIIMSHEKFEMGFCTLPQDSVLKRALNTCSFFCTGQDVCHISDIPIGSYTLSTSTRYS